ncbi:MAG: hypothetical protein JNM89_03185 [Hyphomicrobiaceae bacterium]|nr:hypothetical protein [Hyphomicrobiaceae bacterium]
MSEVGWRALLGSFREGRVDAVTFHDLFFDRWHAAMRDGGVEIPKANETLFFAVEAYCPDPALRHPDSPFEADDLELSEAIRQARARLNSAFQ